jgi:hypothetical protein
VNPTGHRRVYVNRHADLPSERNGESLRHRPAARRGRPERVVGVQATDRHRSRSGSGVANTGPPAATTIGIDPSPVVTIRVDEGTLKPAEVRAAQVRKWLGLGSSHQC